MTTIVDAVATLKAAVETVEGLQCYTEPDKNANPPCVFIDLPQLSWETFNTAQPTDATFILYLVVSANGYSLATLEPLLQQLVTALWDVTDAVVTAAIPGSWGAAPALPAYVLTVEMGL